MSEADTCRRYVLPKLYAAGWDDEAIAEQRYITDGRITPLGHRRYTRQERLRPDYIRKPMMRNARPGWKERAIAVIRFWNVEVMRNLEGVLQVIEEARNGQS
jgi:hypothetical protein